MPEITYESGPSSYVTIAGAGGKRYTLRKGKTVEVPQTTIDKLVKGVSDDHKFKVGRKSASGESERTEGKTDVPLDKAMDAARKGGDDQDDGNS